MASLIVVWNASYIHSLASKVGCSEELKDFRPIFLLGHAYKILLKIFINGHQIVGYQVT